MKSALTFALITFLCTCGRAQDYVDNLPRDITSVAFIKGNTGFLIDSLTIRTTLDTVPYGFAFTDDTLVLDIELFRPADELTLETFTRGHSFGQSRCWADAPTADVHLSINSGRTTIDSVGLSPIDGLFRMEVTRIQLVKDYRAIKRALVEASYRYIDLPLAADFLTTLADMPNLTRQDIKNLASTLKYDIGPVRRHPRYKALLKKNKLMFSVLPGKLEKYDLNDQNGQPVEIETPKSQFYVINIYDSGTPDSRREHQMIAKSMATDSLFTGVPIFSISRESPARSWQRYVREGDFSWPHYHENKAAKRKITEKMQLYPANTYLLINERNLIEGVYDDVLKLGTALIWRRTIEKIP